MDFIVGYMKGPGEWQFAGVYSVDVAPATTPEEEAAAEFAAGEEAGRRAALDHEESDLFGVIPTSKIQEVRIAYRRRVVGIAKDPPA
jgi:hypothetical protein